VVSASAKPTGEGEYAVSGGKEGIGEMLVANLERKEEEDAIPSQGGAGESMKDVPGREKEGEKGTFPERGGGRVPACTLIFPLLWRKGALLNPLFERREEPHARLEREKGGSRPGLPHYHWQKEGKVVQKE